MSATEKNIEIDVQNILTEKISIGNKNNYRITGKSDGRRTSACNSKRHKQSRSLLKVFACGPALALRNKGLKKSLLGVEGEEWNN